MSEINHEYAKLATCPYCGYKDEDSWELTTESGGYDEGEGTADCGMCDKTFDFSRHVDISYSTSKVKP